MPQKPSVVIVWFKRDLRVHDHWPLVKAVASGHAVVPLIIVEPDMWREPDMAGRHFDALGDAARSLQSDLAGIGLDLHIRIGAAVDVFADLAARFDVRAVHAHEETGNNWTFQRDRVVRRAFREWSIPFDEVPPSGVVRGLKSRNGWAAQWEAALTRPRLNVPDTVRPHSLGPGDPWPAANALSIAENPCPDRQPASRVAALADLDRFLTRDGAPYRRAMSAPLSGARHCSRLSVGLAFGTVSLREVVAATDARMKALDPDCPGDRVWRQSLSSFRSRLAWRDHFIQKFEDAPDMEWRNLHPAHDGLRPDETDPLRLEAWAEGRTGLPYVDACMRYLKRTGWLNFRARAMLMAVASYHLWLPWQASGRVLARAFTDYEPGIHWPQVQMQSGTTGINTIRIYNPIKQGLDHDPNGIFIRQEIPELADCPDAFLHEPWHWPGLAATRYRRPIVDPVAAARRARERVHAVRRDREFGRLADAIQDRHGSRKSGIAQRGQRGPRKRSADPAQGVFDF